MNWYSKTSFLNQQFSTGVRLSYSAICNRLWWQFRTFPYTDTEITCVWKTALTFVDSVCEIWGPLLHGRTLLILSKETTRDPQKLVKVLAQNQVRFFFGYDGISSLNLFRIFKTCSKTCVKVSSFCRWNALFLYQLFCVQFLCTFP